MKRIPELDIAKGIAIMGVMMVHLASEYQIITYGIAFHIVVFFAVTGILEKDGISLKHNIQKKARSFLYPYCTMSFLYIVVYSLGHVFTKHEIPINSIIRNCYLTLSGSGIGTLWFLPTAFVGAVIYAAVKSYFKDRAPYIILTLMVLCIIVGKVLCGVGIFGSIHYSISGIFTNELQLLFKGCIAAGFMQSGRWIWQGINFLKTRINTTSFCLSGGGVWFCI